VEDSRSSSQANFNFAAFLESVRYTRRYQDRIAHLHVIPSREAAYGELTKPLPTELAPALSKMGIDRLYTHQCEAIEAVRRGENIVIVTGTASGKTLCYNLPILETLLDEPHAKAIYMFPTKALAQDQLRVLRRYAELNSNLSPIIRAGTYDGDTPQSTRRKLRDEASIILTNPDMLHQGILPYHTKWSKFLPYLRYVVVDEIHTYRGIFGSNVANVMRRLHRICSLYGSKPQFICSSATIANPKELAEKLTGVTMTLIDDDGSPRGRKCFVFWNPPVIDVGGMERRSSNVEAQELMVSLVRNRVRTITFGKARIVAELMYRYVRDALKRAEPALANRVRAYRGGYLPEERREIERQLFAGELLGITSTNALELGIDIGGLDAAIIVGFPGTIASTWQQAGRAGRSLADSLVVFVGYNDPIDQYLMRHPNYFFGQSPESAVIDPENPYILANHMRCAAFELPLRAQDASWFGDKMRPIAEILEECGCLKQIDKTWYYSTPGFPAREIDLRTVSNDTFVILDVTTCNEKNGLVEETYLKPSFAQLPQRGQVIGQVDSISAPELVYPGAVYMHDGETYFVEKLDLQNKVAYVRRADVDYYTNPILDASIRVCHDTSATEDGMEIISRKFSGTSASMAPSLFYGPAVVTWATVGYKKVKFYSLDSIGYGIVNIPPQRLETMAFWLIPPQDLIAAVRSVGRNPIEGLMGIRNLAVHALPFFAMCDKQNIGGIVDSSNIGTPTVFIYDRYSGGLGFAQKAYEMAETFLDSCLQMVVECKCEDGCPSCVGIPTLRPPIHTDPDVFGSFPISDKEATLMMLHAMLGRQPYTPKHKPK